MTQFTQKLLSSSLNNYRTWYISAASDANHLFLFFALGHKLCTLEAIMDWMHFKFILSSFRVHVFQNLLFKVKILPNSLQVVVKNVSEVAILDFTSHLFLLLVQYSEAKTWSNKNFYYLNIASSFKTLQRIRIHNVSDIVTW